jgi:hypothetical protein
MVDASVKVESMDGVALVTLDWGAGVMEARLEGSTADRSIRGGITVDQTVEKLSGAI